jgi:hypothetical protein
VGDGLRRRSHFVDRHHLLIGHPPAPSFSAATPGFATATGDQLSCNDPFVPYFGFIFGNRCQDAGMKPTGRRVEAEAVLQRNKIDASLSQLIE